MSAFIPTAEMIDAVQEWRHRASSDQVRRPLVPLLRDRFNIGAAEAIEIVREHQKREGSTQ
ncbi:hypothetical protein LB531_20875 [Mesorhizobium sp. CO1-1-2]|uniref:hypothetical protein n=1 Tax=Mesorhizobium sp. CO1-1-2 TaxID=2876635 RepID=UPI001CCAF884|nr:hypothetical protein [Mesorhizobium sp. CO1-1-2]MBZ9683115.1 hypothetical protein [Mesorhizobium sp. CO1-1-2]